MGAVHVHSSNVAYGKAIPTVKVRHAYGGTCMAVQCSTVLVERVRQGSHEVRIRTSAFRNAAGWCPSFLLVRNPKPLFCP
jgi:hypothetical protein